MTYNPLQTMSNIEPNLNVIDGHKAQASIAVSTKRIADSLEQLVELQKQSIDLKKIELLLGYSGLSQYTTTEELEAIVKDLKERYVIKE